VTSTDSLTLSQLESYLWKAAWILKGPVDAADFKTYVFPLLSFKRISGGLPVLLSAPLPRASL
jgi:type I restriction enzyme M protein